MDNTKDIEDGFKETFMSLKNYIKNNCNNSVVNEKMKTCHLMVNFRTKHVIHACNKYLGEYLEKLTNKDKRFFIHYSNYAKFDKKKKFNKLFGSIVEELIELDDSRQEKIFEHIELLVLYSMEYEKLTSKMYIR